MSVRLTRLPSTSSVIASYDWQRAPNAGGVPGTWVDLASVTHDLLGPNYDPVTEHFFYEDVTGDATEWYHARCVDTDGNPSGWTLAFHPSESTTPPPFPNTVVLNQNYGTTNALQATDPNGVPLIGVQIRVWRKVDFDLQRYEAALGTTTTNVTGGWVQPLTVEAGYTYVVQYYKPGLFGPNTTEVVVP